MDQDLSTFQATFYVDDVDGLAGINLFSQDLAFELYTTEQAIPEPATMSLLAIGLLLLGFVARRRRRP